jgi:uncharacterized protein involved in exopolysaccharide biosynthesis
LTETPETIPKGEEIDHNPFLISTLEARLVELELEEKELLTKYRPESPFVANVRDEIQMVRRKLKEQENKRYGKTQYGPNPTHQNLKETLLRDEANLEALKAKRLAQIKQLAEYEDRLEKLNEIEGEIKHYQNEVDVNWENYRLYQSKLEESRISDAMDTEKIVNFSLIEPARPPIKPERPKIILNLVIGAALGLFIAFGSALTLEYFNDRLETPEDVEEHLDLPILASIPEFNERKTSRS